MEPAKFVNNFEDEQKVIVKFLIFNNHKRGYKIQKQLVKIYNENTVSINKIEDWIEEFVGLRTATSMKLNEVTDTTLHRTDNPWRPSFISKIENDELKTEHILKKVLRILNKITEENYFTLLEQLRSLPINTEDCLRKVVKEILAYVCDEHKYSNLYAKLCLHLSSKYVPYEQQIIGACPMYLTFNELVRSGCVDELTMKLKESETLDYNNENKVRYKLKGLNIFISELYKANALMIEVVDEEYLNLLFDENLQKNLFKIECCYICLNNLGKFLELQCNEAPPKFQKEIFDGYFKKLSNILENDSNTKLLPSYLRFNIMELIELRTRNWIPRANQKDIKNYVDNFNKKKPKFTRIKKFSYGRRGKFFNTKQRSESKTRNESMTEDVKSPLQIKLDSLGEDVQIERKVRSCLNKMTDKNSNKLIEQILALPLETISERIITLIVNKAISEPLFNHVYADLCRQLCQKTLSSTNTEDNEEDKNKVTITFQELIKNECSKIWSTKINSVDNIDDEYYFKKKILSKGIPKFISELLKLEIISYEIIKSYIEPLFDENKQTISNIELLCNFLSYCGHLIEKNDNECIENYFKNIKILNEKTPKFPKRICFMLLDLLELRERKWLPRLIQEPVLIASKNTIYREQMRKNRLERRMKNLSISNEQKNRNQSRSYRRNFKFDQKKTIENESNSSTLNTNDNQSSNGNSNDVPSSNDGTSLDLGVSSSNETNNA